jgi:hypothetical protein
MLPPSEALNRFEPPAGYVPVAVEAVSKSVRYGFRAGALALLIRQGTGSEVTPMMPVTSIPNGPSWLLGMINLRGNLVPVCDMTRALGLGGGSGSAKSMILILDKGDRAAGFVIDGYPCALSGLRTVGQVADLPGPLAPHVLSALADDDDVWLEFDHAGFLAAASR